MTDVNTMVERLERNTDMHDIGDVMNAVANRCLEIAVEKGQNHSTAHLYREQAWQEVAMALIRSQQEEIAVLREALEPFKADIFNDFCPDETPAWYFDDEDNSPSPITVGDFRRARAAGRREG